MPVSFDCTLHVFLRLPIYIWQRSHVFSCQTEAMATGFQCFWSLSLTLSLYFIHSTSSSHVTSICKTLLVSLQLITTLILRVYFCLNQVYIVYLGHANYTDPLLTYEHHVRHLTSVFHRSTN